MYKLTLVKRGISHQETKDSDTFWEDEYNYKNSQLEKNRMQNA